MYVCCQMDILMILDRSHVPWAKVSDFRTYLWTHIDAHRHTGIIDMTETHTTPGRHIQDKHTTTAQHSAVATTRVRQQPHTRQQRAHPATTDAANRRRCHGGDCGGSQPQRRGDGGRRRRR